ncbi:Shedu anti-phage system protein SduA domain-containing protein [Paenibacillus sp. Mc5Re-14]|uniref:Shedu anti-phage system protein SduA domain-containing protein n=1 Tax=Paenibacillus sp. Mc5Re-14 TaxID=1030529 RepID=UPI000B2930C3|nr:Shedu anti-phage system protein SduA domain-containing protein [Paenibacillus sp. Mc5Re-14]
MKIYERDSTYLTDEELKLWDEKKEGEKVRKLGEKWIRKSLFREYPKAARHFMSLFPNNYLDIEELKKESELNYLCEKYAQMLDSPGTPERTVLNWIRENKAYFIIASILQNYNFGHHDAFIFPELKLGTAIQVDFLIIGKNSGGYEFIFVELEARYGKITLSDGDLGDAFRKGIRQVKDWSDWLESYYTSFQEAILKYKNAAQQLPLEFMVPDRTRIHFVVVAGRRTDFNEKTYRTKRRTKTEQNIELLHYDNLYDTAKEVVGKATY